MPDDERIETIEIKLAHLERGLLELSDVVVRQQAELESMRSRNARLADLIVALESSGAGAASSDDEKPPHY
jgi:SlyX protein